MATQAPEQPHIQAHSENHIVAEVGTTEAALQILSLNKGCGFTVLVDDTGKVRIVLRDMRLPAACQVKISTIEKSKLV